MLRTLSSVMEKPVFPIWDHCTEDIPCVMPNIKRTPDIAIVIFPDDYEKDISYPIFIGEVLGKVSRTPIQSMVQGIQCSYADLSVCT